MTKKKNEQPKISDEEICRLVMERLSMLSPNKSISIGSNRSFSKDELIKEIKNRTDVGKKMVEIEIEFLQSLKDLPIYGPKIASNN